MRPSFWIRCSSIAAAVFVVGGCAINAQQPHTVAASHLDAVQKAGVLRICTPGDYKPFSFQKPDASYEGIDVDLMTSFSSSLNAKPEWVKTTWANLLPDLAAGKCDLAVGGVSVTTERQKRAFFSAPYMVNGKTPIARCADVAKYQSVAAIDKPEVRVIFNPGGSNERFARANFKRARLTMHGENVTIFDEILANRADVFVTEAAEAITQQKLKPGLCAINPDKPLQYGEMAWMLPRVTWHSRPMSINGCTWHERAASSSASWTAGSSNHLSELFMETPSGAVMPAVYGQSDRPPRGDYSRGGAVLADYTCPQDWASYTPADHDTYRRLYERQAAQLPGLACDTFIESLPLLGIKDRIPRFDEINERLYAATRWEIVAVPGLIPELPFFTLLANRKFPVTDWIRKPEEFDYIVEPDVFHDLFGHVPMLFDPTFADYVQRYGQGGIKAHDLGAGEKLARLYWYTVEFGLIRQPEGLRAYGAGILSSVGELKHAVRSTEPLRLPLDLLRAMRTRYKIDTYQRNYFVIDSFTQLFDLTAPDFTPLYQALARQPDIEAGVLLPGESSL